MNAPYAVLQMSQKVESSGVYRFAMTVIVMQVPPIYAIQSGMNRPCRKSPQSALCLV